MLRSASLLPLRLLEQPWLTTSKPILPTPLRNANRWRFFSSTNLESISSTVPNTNEDVDDDDDDDNTPTNAFPLSTRKQQNGTSTNPNNIQDSRRRRTNKPRIGNNRRAAEPLALPEFFAYFQKQQQQQQQQTNSESSSSSSSSSAATAITTTTRITKTPPLFWRNPENQRMFCDWAGKCLGITHLDDWYRITIDDFRRVGGAGVLQMHHTSLHQVLRAVYPQHEWLPWRFAQTRAGFWRQNNTDNHKLFFEWAATQLGLKSLDDWYAVTIEHICKLGGGGLLQICYRGSLQQALAAVYPHHEWLPWKFQSTLKGFWRDRANQKLFLEWAGKQLGVRQLDDWYSLGTVENIRRLGGNGLLRAHRGSLQQALYVLYPEHEWLPWRFLQTQKHFWSELSNRKAFFDWAGRQLGVTCLDDWYGIIAADLEKKLGGVDGGCSLRRLLQRYYNYSLQQALYEVYPHHEWLPWKFHHTSKTFWRDRANHRRYLDWAGRQLGVKTLPDDWYAFTTEDIEKLDGAGLIREYGTLQHALPAVYPEYEWLPWMFRFVYKGFWSDRANQRMFLDWAAKQLGVRKLDDWYDIVTEDLEEFGGVGFVQRYYNGSLHQALSAVYPEHDWQLYRFRAVDVSKLVGGPNDDAAAAAAMNVRPYVEHLAKGLGIQRLEDWNRVSQQHILDVGGHRALRIVKKFGGLASMLLKAYPDHPWEEGILPSQQSRRRGKKASQRWLLMAAKQLFPDALCIHSK